MCFLWHIFPQVQKVKRDYNRLKRKHGKYVKDNRQRLDISDADSRKSSAEICRLNSKILVSVGSHALKRFPIEAAINEG
jgi:PAB1-binding protein PBP1